MTINLNDPKDLTPTNVQLLIASTDDSQDRQLRVTKEGIAFISDTVGGQSLEGILFRLETFGVGNGYLGPKAADDADWVDTVYQVLKKNYPKPSSSYIDTY